MNRSMSFTVLACSRAHILISKAFIVSVSRRTMRAVTVRRMIVMTVSHGWMNQHGLCWMLMTTKSYVRPVSLNLSEGLRLC